ncbi:MAG: PLDc N-terminal domain-containing protein [Candidatus Omnitrophica bacterium]|nr:PLDc N-terminal domain-containing protein [Candidatus Omnitrophota bacterium]
MEFLFTAFVVIFDIVAIIDAMRAKLPVEKKILWIVLIVAVPMIGLFLYFLLGRPSEIKNV